MKNRVTPLIVLRSILLWTIVGLASVPYTVLGLILVPLFRVQLRYKIMRSWGWLFTYLAKLICRVNYKVTGLSNITNGAAIVASNHQSMWETVAFSTIFPPYVPILKRELLKFPFFGWAIATLEPIAINRAKGSEAVYQIINQGTAKIKNGFVILVFPEGTRVKPGVKKSFKIGVAKISKMLNLPIIPVAHNAGYVLPKASFWMYPGTVDIIIDKPLYPQDYDKVEDLIAKLQQVVQSNLETITH